MLRLVCSRYRHVDHTLTISKSLQCSYSNSHSCSYRSCNTNSYSSSYTYSCSYNSESCRINNSYKYNHTYSNTSSYSSINSDGHNPSHNHSYSIDNIEQKYEELVRSWPGNYLQPINMLFQRIRENHNYELIANNKHIDTNNWNDYLNRYRRSIIKLPLETLGSKEDLINFCSIVDNYMNILVTNQKLLEKQSKHNKTEDDKGSELVQQIQLLSNNQLSNWKPNSDSFEDVLVNDILSKAAVDLADVIAAYSVLATTSDLRFPHNWYPLTRLTKRKVFYHGGPTNSGKTYEALQRLRQADPKYGGGLYCGPLRLLALEVYEQLSRQGIYINLLTGQEKRVVPFATHISSTLEMVSLAQEYDVAVIDEIQMISDRERGYAWTRALLGLNAREIHICGGLEATDVVRSLMECTGDNFELIKYERMSKLQIADESLRGDYSKVRPGDCVVAFSKADIFSIRKEIERTTNYKCAIIYGQLPSETRSTQARLFNDPNSGFDILVASDAIGMGLNLNIGRIIFHTTVKRGDINKPISYIDPSNIKQIAGRAGRRSSNYPIGLVTSWQDCDLAYIRAVMDWDIEQISSVGIFPSIEQIEIFSKQLQKVSDASATSLEQIDENNSITDNSDMNAITRKANNGVDVVEIQQPNVQLSQIMEKFVKLSKIDNKYFLCNHDSLIIVSNWLHSIPLSLTDRFIFSNAPVNINDANIMNMLYQYAALYAQNKPILLDIWFFDSLPKNLDIFANICSKHNLLDLYLWLSFRFPNHFIERDLCLKRKEFAINIIESTLSKSKLQQSRNSSSHVVTYKKNREKILLKNNNYLPVLFGDNKEIYQSTKKYLSLMDKDKLFVYPTEENTNENPSKEENNWKKQKRNENKDTKKKGKRALNKVTQKNDEVIADLVATMTSTN